MYVCGAQFSKFYCDWLMSGYFMISTNQTFCFKVSSAEEVNSGLDNKDRHVMV